MDSNVSLGTTVVKVSPSGLNRPLGIAIDHMVNLCLFPFILISIVSPKLTPYLFATSAPIIIFFH